MEKHTVAMVCAVMASLCLSQSGFAVGHHDRVEYRHPVCKQSHFFGSGGTVLCWRESIL